MRDELNDPLSCLLASLPPIHVSQHLPPALSAVPGGQAALDGTGIAAAHVTALAALIVAALFWGNCFSCPQLLLSLAQHAPHGCCKRPAPVTQTCTTNVLKHFVKADPVPVTPPAAAPAEAQAFVPAPMVYHSVATIDAPHSPPDRLALTSLLRI